MVNKHTIVCPFCGQYMGNFNETEDFYCKTCGVSSIKDKAIPRLKYVPSASKKSVCDTFEFLELVRRGEGDFYFSKTKPFKDDFCLADVLVLKKEDLLSNRGNVLRHIREDSLDLIACGKNVAHNLNKVFAYVTTYNSVPVLDLTKFPSVGNYVFNMACIDTCINSTFLNLHVGNLEVANNLPFVEGYAALFKVYGDIKLPKLSDEGLMFSLMFNPIMSDIESAFVAPTVVLAKELLKIYTSRVVSDEAKPMADYEDLRNMPDRWRNEFLYNYCKSSLELFINSVDDKTFSTYSLLDNSFDLSYEESDLTGGNFRKEIPSLQFLGYLTERYLGQYKSILGYESKLDVLKKAGLPISDKPDENIISFWKLTHAKITGES